MLDRHVNFSLVVIFNHCTSDYVHLLMDVDKLSDIYTSLVDIFVTVTFGFLTHKFTLFTIDNNSYMN